MFKTQSHSKRDFAGLTAHLRTNLMASARSVFRSVNLKISTHIFRGLERVNHGDAGVAVDRLLERRITALEDGLVDARRLITDLMPTEQSAVVPARTKTPDGDSDLLAAVAGAERSLGPLKNVASKTFATADGKRVRFFLSSPWNGDVDKGYVSIRESHFATDYLFFSIRGNPSAWMIPTSVVRTLLESIPAPMRSNGSQSWDPKFGIRKGIEVFWASKAHHLNIAYYRIGLAGVGENENGPAEVVTTVPEVELQIVSEKATSPSESRVGSTDFQALLANVQRQLGEPASTAGRNAVTASGAKIRMSLSTDNPIKGRALVNIRPGDLDLDWIAVAMKGDPSTAWLVPMSVLKEFLRNKPEKKIGGWNVQFGVYNPGEDRIWIKRNSSIFADSYRIRSL